MKNKRIIITALAIITLVTVFVIPASANNHTDQYFGYSIPSFPYKTIDEYGYEKRDASGSYVYSYSTNPNALRYSAFGYSSDHYTNETNLNNCTKYDYAIVYAGQKRRIRQYVYERGYRYAFLGCAANNADGGHAIIQGLWRPDSVGSDPYAN